MKLFKLLYIHLLIYSCAHYLFWPVLYQMSDTLLDAMSGVSEKDKHL